MLQLCEEQLNYIAMDCAWFVRLIGRVVLKKKLLAFEGRMATYIC